MCEIGYRATRRDLWRRRQALAPILARHGYRLRTEILADEGRSVWDGVGLVNGRSGGKLAERLSGVLTRLERPAPRRRARLQRP